MTFVSSLNNAKMFFSSTPNPHPVPTFTRRVGKGQCGNRGSQRPSRGKDWRSELKVTSWLCPWPWCYSPPPFLAHPSALMVLARSRAVGMSLPRGPWGVANRTQLRLQQSLPSPPTLHPLGPLARPWPSPGFISFSIKQSTDTCPTSQGWDGDPVGWRWGSPKYTGNCI